MNRYIDLHCTYDFDNWIEGFARLHHGFRSFDYYQSFVKDGPIIMERKIIDHIQDHSIDLVIVPNMYYEINSSFLKKLRSSGVRTLIVFFDDSVRFEDASRYYLGHCDYIVTHESKSAIDLYQPYGGTVDFFPCFPSRAYFDHLLGSCVNGIPRLGDVSFVGAKIADRAVFIDALIEAGLPVSVYGGGWPSGRVSQSEMLQIFRDSKISLNFTKSLASNGSKQLKARAFEIVLAGGFLLTEHDAELADYFELGSEIDTFSNLDECVQKVRYYLKNPGVREAMRQKAYEKSRGFLNFEAAWTAYLSNLESLNRSNDISQPFEIPPYQAIRSFARWNVNYLVGRFVIREPGLAIDQLRWFIREGVSLSETHTKAVWLLFIAEWILPPLRWVKNGFVRSRLLQKARRRFFPSFQKG